MIIRLWDSRANLIRTLPTKFNPSSRALSNKIPSIVFSMASNRAPIIAPIPRAPIPRAPIPRAPIPRAFNSRASTSSMAGFIIVRFSGMNKVMDMTNMAITLFLINIVIYITPLNIRSIISTVMHTVINIVTLNTSNPIYLVVVVS